MYRKDYIQLYNNPCRLCPYRRRGRLPCGMAFKADSGNGHLCALSGRLMAFAAWQTVRAGLLFQKRSWYGQGVGKGIIGA